MSWPIRSEKLLTRHRILDWMRNRFRLKATDKPVGTDRDGSLTDVPQFSAIMYSGLSLPSIKLALLLLQSCSYLSSIT
ncbi:hypothetical protein J6590_073668 [Homalodisca vitripennis]|nr:hypothetical protein J6590_073668 [Homalodisca vitripennis]